MAGDADPPDQTFGAGLERGIERAAGAQRLVPLDRIRQRVDLPEVDVVDAEAVEGAVDFVTRTLLVALVALGCDEEAVRLAPQPGFDAKLRVARSRTQCRCG